MNTYDRFQSSLLSEFKRKAQPHVRSLWADLMELSEVTTERSLSTARAQALQRIRVLERAAGAANAHHVRSLSQALELMLDDITQVLPVARPELFEALCETMRKLTEALYSIDAEAHIFEADQPTEMALAGSCAD
jgi:hypothetical protein